MSVANCTISEWKNGGSNETGLYPVQYIGNKRAEQAGIGDYYMNDGSLVDKDAALTDAQTASALMPKPPSPPKVSCLTDL